jgi:hypothetical protein
MADIVPFLLLWPYGHPTYDSLRRTSDENADSCPELYADLEDAPLLVIED